MAVVATTWLLYVTPAAGGHDWQTAAGLLAMVPALLVTRPWQRVSPVLLGLSVAVALGGLLVLELTPTGWEQADSVAAHVAGALAAVLAVSYATTPARRVIVVVVLLVGVLVQFQQSWLQWWGSGDPNRLMVGSFYWHNQFGAFMAALGVVGLALVVVGRRWQRAAGFVTMPFAATGVILSTSRTSLALLLVGWLWIGAVALTSSSRARAVAAWAAASLATVALLYGVTSSVFFPDHRYDGPPLLHSASSDHFDPGGRGLDTLSGNGADRLDWSQAAVRAWAARPVTGNGFGSFWVTSPTRLRAETWLTPFVHDGYADALTSGGLLFGGPVIALALLALVWAARGTWAACRRAGPERGILLGTGLATGILLAHSAVDFDWHYSALIVSLGIVAGVVYRSQVAPSAPRTTPQWLAITALLLATAIGVAASLVEYHGREASVAQPGPRDREVRRLLDAQLPGAYDPRYGLSALDLLLKEPVHGIDPGLAQRVISATARYADIDPTTARKRAALEALSRATDR
jgi:hypothetical protein